jgi:L-iditol 2-dehydrogenase
MSNEQGSFVEPLAVGVHILGLAPVTPASRLVILGAGTIGLMCLFAARARGVTEITMTDRVDDKLSLAQSLGAKHTLNVDQTPLKDFCRETYGAALAFDVALECVGVAGTVRDGIATLKKGGAMVVAGVFPSAVPVELGLVQDRELKLFGSLMYQMNDFEAARDLIASGQAPVERLITHRYPLDQVPMAMRYIEDQPERNVKTMIHIRPQAR